MNIDSASLSTLTASGGTVESLLPPLTDGSVISEGFSGALVEQIGLLSNIKAGDLSPLSIPDITVLQGGNDSPDVAGLPMDKTTTQDFAALLGNDLPLSYKTKEDVGHEAALALVTDTLKYIAVGTTAGEKAAEAERNMKDVIAMTVSSPQNIKGAGAPLVLAEQNVKNVIAMTVSARQNIQDAVAATSLVEKDVKDAVASSVLAEQNSTDIATGAGQDMSIVMDAPVQMNLIRPNDKPDKKRVEGDAKTAGVDDNRGALELLVDIVLPVVMPIEQSNTANNLADTDVIESEALLSFIKPSTGDAKSSWPLKAPNDGLPSETIFRQPVQDKQGFNLKYFDNAGQSEKTGLVERQVLNSEGEKTLPRVGTDMAALNRSVVENKVDVPAITKPLSHPEWNKDLGERIVWMSSKAIPAAEIRLNPQHLGPISVRVNVADDQATVVFTAQHAATREALEASIPKLREMMGAQQLNLVEVNVSQGGASDHGRSQTQNFAQTAGGRGQHSAAGAVIDGVDDVEQEIESGRAVVSKGLLSLYV